MVSHLSLVIECGRTLWHWRLGDTDPLGLAFTAGYVLVFALMLRTLLTRQAGVFASRRDRQMWLCALVLFGLLALNKQLDLQSYAFEVGRCVSLAEGWYDIRAGFEHSVARTLLALTAAAGLALLVWFRADLWRNRRLIFGMALLTAYVLLQITDFLHLDQHLRALVDGEAQHRALEALALATLAWAAWAKRAGH